MWDYNEEEERGCFYFTGRYFVEYTRTATIHGIRYISRRTAFERLLWGILTLSFVLICLAQIIKLYSRLHYSPVVVTFATERASVFEVPFPALTICPEAKTHREKFNYEEVRIKLENNENLTEFEQSMYEYIYVLCDRFNHTQKERYHTKEFFTDDLYTSLDNMSFDFFGATFRCEWMMQMVPCRQIFTKVFTERGICYSFNFLDKSHIFKNVTRLPEGFFDSFRKTNDWDIEKGYGLSEYFDNYPRRVFSPGSEDGLKLMLKVTNEDFSGSCRASFPGFRVIVHSPYNIPQSKENFFRMSPNRAYIAKVNPSIMTTASSVRQFQPKIRQCYMPTERTLKYFHHYSYTNCMSECLSNYSLLRCECVGHSVPRSEDVPVCGTKSYECLQNAELELKLLEIWNSLESNLSGPSFCDCLPSCTNIKYQVEISPADSLWDIRDWNISENDPLPTILGVYFKQDNFMKIERNEAFTVFELIAKIGGLLGLYTGASIVTVIKFLYFWSGRLCCNKRLFGRWTGHKPHKYEQ